MEFIKGMDISMVKELEVSGASYYINGKQEDLFRILKECGTTMVRLRIWSDPFDEMGNSYGGGGNDLQTTIENCRKNCGKRNGLYVRLSLQRFLGRSRQTDQAEGMAEAAGRSVGDCSVSAYREYAEGT